MPMIAVIMLFSLLSACTTGNNTTTIFSPKDTVLLFKKDTAIVTGTAVSYIELHIPREQTTGAIKNSQLILVLYTPKVIASPEGVYEVYLTNTLNESEKLVSSQKNFVTLLDLYSFTAPGAQQQVEIDITAQVKNLYATGKPASRLFVLLKFAPVQLADGTFSAVAGEVRFSGTGILRVND